MPSSDPVEHFVTLFDSNFLPMGMCLHASLMEHGKPFHLWIVCIDERVEAQLSEIELAHASLIPLREVETDALRAVKETRTRGEYCWTLTPFAPQFVFDRAGHIGRVTYVDADLFFFDSPARLMRELDESGKQVLITEHAYAPEYDRTELAGRFCVQFMSFNNSDGGLKVLHWWQDKCLDWCFDQYEEERFGDQKYLDRWPELFPDEVHILAQVEKALAPWNVRYFADAHGGRINPVFYHFQAFRIVAPDKVLLYTAYKVGPSAGALYAAYLRTLRSVIREMAAHGFDLPCLPLRSESWETLRKIKRRLFGTEAYASLAG